MSARGAIDVVAVAGLATVQDLGRPGHMHEGVPPGGALVPELLAWANDAVGNAASAAAIEVIGAISVVAVTAARVSIDGDRPRDLAPGDRLDVPRSPVRRVRYVAMGGGVDVPVVLGARATLLVAALGGHEGRALRRGDRLVTGGAPATCAGNRTAASVARDLDLDLDAPIAVVPGPDGARFEERALATLLDSAFTVTASSDRTGTRLEGPALLHRAGVTGATRVLSTPMVAGAIEVPASGAPIVLGPDHPTTGGYPVLATVVRADLGRFAARKIGASVRFTALLSPRK